MLHKETKQTGTSALQDGVCPLRRRENAGEYGQRPGRQQEDHSELGKRGVSAPDPYEGLSGFGCWGATPALLSGLSVSVAV